MAQGSENAIATGVIGTLLVFGLVLFFIVMIVIKVFSQKNKREAEDESDLEQEPIHDAQNNLETHVETGSRFFKGCIILIICLIIGAMIGTMMFK